MARLWFRSIRMSTAHFAFRRPRGQPNLTSIGQHRRDRQPIEHPIIAPRSRGGVAEGGLDQAYRVPAAERRAGGRLRPANVAVTRGLVAALLAALGVVAVTAGLIEVSVAAGRSV